MDPETNPKVVCTMGPFLTRFNRVHLNKILDIQGKDFKDLSTMHKHMDAKTNKSILCYHKALGFCPGNGLGNGCKFCHVAGNVFSSKFLVELCR